MGFSVFDSFLYEDYKIQKVYLFSTCLMSKLEIISVVNNIMYKFIKLLLIAISDDEAVINVPPVHNDVILIWVTVGIKMAIFPVFHI